MKNGRLGETLQGFHPSFSPCRLKAELQTRTHRISQGVRARALVVPPSGGSGREGDGRMNGSRLRDLLQFLHPPTFQGRLKAELQTRTPRKSRGVRSRALVVPPSGGTGRQEDGPMNEICLRDFLQFLHPPLLQSRLKAELQTRTHRKSQGVRAQALVVPPSGGIGRNADAKDEANLHPLTPSTSPSETLPRRLKAELQTRMPRKPQGVRAQALVVPPSGGTGREANAGMKGLRFRKQPSTYPFSASSPPPEGGTTNQDASKVSRCSCASARSPAFRRNRKGGRMPG
jgi:hypothetical protein